MTEAGAQVVWRTTVGDNIEIITEAIGRAMQRAELVIATGGLGPTSDDLTKKAICKYFKRQLIFHDNILKKIEKRYAARGVKMPAINQNQALLPQGAELIDNKHGSAVGIVMEQDGKLFVATPGVPMEMKPMIEGWVVENIKKRAKGQTTLHRKIHTFGIIESAIHEKIADLIEGKQPGPLALKISVAFLPSFKGVDLRLSLQTSRIDDGKKAIAILESKITERISDFIFGHDDDTLPQVVGKLLSTHHLTLAVAESCTGGYLGKVITDIPGSSAYFLGGVIAYSNEIKMKSLSVPQIILEKYGAVSEECARYMAEGVSQNLGANIGVSITGIAGPDGGTDEKPVGLVYIGISYNGKTEAQLFNFGAERERNRERAVYSALDMIRRVILG